MTKAAQKETSLVVAFSGIEARQQEKKRFIALADRLARSRDVDEQTRLKEELAVMTFGQ